MSSIPVAIKEISFYVPETVFTNDDMKKLVDTSDEWIRQRTGIVTRHLVSGDEDAVSMAVNAVKKLYPAGLNSQNTPDMIVCATSAPVRPYPSVACEVQAAIGADDASAFDITAACSGFIYAMQIARANIQSGFANRVLVVASDATSKFLDWTDRGSCVLFGDGAAAMVVEKSEDGQDDFVALKLKADGKCKEMISLKVKSENCPLTEPSSEDEHNNKIFMAGRDVYKYVMQKIPAVIAETLNEAGLTVDDIDFFVPHQANLRMIEALSSRIGFPPEKVLTNVEKYGNISASSIPAVISEKLADGSIKCPATLLISAFGAGMTSSAAIIRLREHTEG
ncbi:MAG: beta-ketoacyl-ACP synthase III [Candidatus Gastranaerophilaceae bacterium]